MAVLRQVSGQQVPWIVNKMVTEPVRSEDVAFSDQRWRGAGSALSAARHQDAPGLMVLHGVHHLGIDEPRLMSFAAAMASCGLRVLTPELPGIKDYHVITDSVKVIGESANGLRGRRARRSG